MVTLPLFTSYKRYKAEESTLLSWLTKTAEKCGYKSNSKNKDLPQSRNQSRKNGAVSQKKNIVPIAELASLAKAVTAQAPSYSVLSTYTQLLRDIIHGRKKSNKFYERQSSAETGEFLRASNQGHKHYIGVLEDVLAIFDRALKKLGVTPKPDGTSYRLDNADAQLSNLFELLEVEASSAQIRDSGDEDTNEVDSEHGNARNLPDTKTLKPKKRAKGKKAPKPSPPPEESVPENFDFELEADESDIYFLIYCFFEDFNEIRDYVQERWCDYLDGLLSLQAVAVITNTAYDIFQRSEAELISQIPRDSGLRDYGEMAMMLFAQAGLAHVDYDSQPTEGEAANDAMSDEASWVCLPVYWNLSEFLTMSPPGKLPTQPPRALKESAAVSGKHRGDGRLGWNRALLLEILMESCLIKALKVGGGLRIPAEDELTRGLVEMMKTRRIPIWLIFACQLYLDIRYVLEVDVERAHKELLAMGPRVRSTLGNYVALAKESGVITQGPIITTIKEVRCFVTEDFPEPSRTDLHVKHGRPAEDVEPFFYLRRQPILCGLMVFRYNLTLQEFGLVVGTGWGATLAAAHLYNAIRQVSAGSWPWQDMEALIAIHGEGYLFVGGRPTTIADCAKRFALANGASVSNFSTGQVNSRNGHSAPSRNRQLTPSPNGPRTLESTSVVSQIFHKRYCFDNETRVETLFHVEQLLNNQLPPKLILSNLDNDDLLPADGAGESSSAIEEFNGSYSGLKKQFDILHGLSPVQLLETLATRITNESVLLTFNYFSMHERCSHFFQSVYIEFKKEIIGLNKGPLEGGIEEAPRVVEYVFLLLAMDEECTMGIAARLAGILKHLVEKEGNAEILAVRRILTEKYS